MAEINSWNVSAGSNNGAAPNGAPEGMAAADVNNTMREMMAVAARWHKDTNASIAAGGTGDAITVSANQMLAAYYDGLEIAFNATAANTTATTLNVDSVGAKKVFKNFNAELIANDIKSGQKVIVIYDSDGDSSAGAWQMVSPLGNGSTAASESTAGVVELATQAEVNTGTDTARAITPAGLTGWTPAVGTVTVAADDKVLLADASASGVLKQGLVSDITGKLVQRVYASFATHTSINASVPNDDSIPQSGEGVEIITAAITPTSATNRLRIRTVIPVAGDGNGGAVIALFQDSTANALMSQTTDVQNGIGGPLIIEYEMEAGTTSATTFKARVGTNGGAPGNIYVCGNSSGRRHGGVLLATMVIEEIRP